MNGISANWTALLDAATRLKTNGKTLEELIHMITADVTSTQDVWQGAAAQAYQEQWVTLLPQFKQASENIMIMGSQIINYVGAQQEIEQQARDTYQR